MAFSTRVICFLALFGITIAYAQKNIDADVLIIGAGLSGLGAATKLDRAGIKVAVLEAEPQRIGGRVNSIKFGDAHVEVGAEWVHGEVDNSVYQMVKNDNLLRHANDTDGFYRSDGVQGDEDFEQELFDLYYVIYDGDSDAANSKGHRSQTPLDYLKEKRDEIVSGIKSRKFHKKPTRAAASVGQYFEEDYFEIIEDWYGDEPEKLAIAQLAYNSFSHYILAYEGAFSTFDLLDGSDYQDCEGDQQMSWNGNGYISVVKKLVKDFDVAGKVHMNKTVTNIAYNSTTDNVTVTLTSGEQYSAKHVLFTPSLGVLKHSHETLFTPKLSALKVEAIETLGIAAVMKVMTRYSERWWTYDLFDGPLYLWSKEDRKNLINEGKEWLLDFMSAFQVDNNPHVLSCWFTGEYVAEIENKSNEEVVDGIMFALRKAFGARFNVTEPVEVARYKWYDNPNFRGAYSFQTPESYEMDGSPNDVLAAPITNAKGVPKILFAGEATHPYYYSTTHGALDSGVREADRLIKLFEA